MPTSIPTVKIAIAASSEKRRRILKSEVERRSGVEVVACTALTEAFLHQLNSANADVLLVDMFDDGEPEPEIFQQLLSTKGVPIVFNDNDGESDVITQAWVDKLIKKLATSLDKKNKKSKPLRIIDEDPTDANTRKRPVRRNIKYKAKETQKESSFRDRTEEFSSSEKKSKRNHDYASRTGFDAIAIDFEQEMGIPILDENSRPGSLAENADRKSVAQKPERKQKQVKNNQTSDIAVKKQGQVPKGKSKTSDIKRAPILKKRPKAQQSPISKPKSKDSRPSTKEIPRKHKIDAKDDHIEKIKKIKLKPVPRQDKDSVPNADVFTAADIQFPESKYVKTTPRINAKDIWVLGASIGGPQAVKRFLSILPEGLNVSFILVQHIGMNFVDLLAEQLERSTPFRVFRAVQGSEIMPNQVIVTPADQDLTFDINGSIKLQHRSKAKIYNPCIDDVLFEVNKSFPGANAIIFSGMGDDGAQGIAGFSKTGGYIWAQNPDSCIVSSMPDCAREKGVVSFSGTPEQLAEHLIRTVKKAENQPQLGVS